MKTTPTIQSAESSASPISRTTAAYHLRRERAEGKIVTVLSGYLLTAQVKFIVSPKPVRKPAPVEAEPFSLSVRKTHKYVTGWNHLDQWHAVGTATIVAAKDRVRNDDGDTRHLVILKVDAPGYRPRNIIRAIEDTMRSGCRCEHDCCGHIQTYVRKVRQLCPGTFAVRISGYANI